MFAPLVAAVLTTSVVLALWALWFVVRNRAVILRQLWGAGVVEVLLAVQLVAGGVAVSGRTGVDAVTFWGYLVTILFILPVAAVWSFAERTRWSSVVLLVAGLTVVFLEYRLVQIWGGA
ncbi:MAG: hypothetical protein ACTMIR_12575 [Cellulomonadaceae bacterium]